MPKAPSVASRRVRFEPFASSVSPNSSDDARRQSDTGSDRSTRSRARSNLNDEVVGPVVQVEETIVPGLDEDEHSSPPVVEESLRPSPPLPPTVTHLYINNRRVMSRAKDWGSVLDPVGISSSLTLDSESDGIVGLAATTL